MRFSFCSNPLRSRYSTASKHPLNLSTVKAELAHSEGLICLSLCQVLSCWQHVFWPPLCPMLVQPYRPLWISLFLVHPHSLGQKGCQFAIGSQASCTARRPAHCSHLRLSGWEPNWETAAIPHPPTSSSGAALCVGSLCAFRICSPLCLRR